MKSVLTKHKDAKSRFKKAVGWRESFFLDSWTRQTQLSLAQVLFGDEKRWQSLRWPSTMCCSKALLTMQTCMIATRSKDATRGS